MTLAQLQADLTAKREAARALLEQYMRAASDEVIQAATATTPEVRGRQLTATERGEVQALLDEAKAIKVRIDAMYADSALQTEIDRLTAGMAAACPQDTRAVRRDVRSIGEQFVTDPRYRAFIDAGLHRNAGAWSSPSVELFATTLDTSGGSGGPLILEDQRPGIVPLLFRRLTIVDLLARGMTDSNVISFMKEKTFTNAASAVAEGGSKPESTLVFEAATSTVKKIAHWIPVTEEMLQDYAQTQSVVDARLRLGLALTEEDQLLNGSGSGANLLGLMNLTGLTAAQPRGSDTNMDAIFKSITTLSTSVFVVPDGFAINPANWQTIQLAKDSQGNYLGSGPWSQAQTPALWGLPAAVTPAIVANTALVGAYRQSAQYFRHGGVRVESSNSHADFFIKNLVAIRGEQRGALVVYRESAFQKVTGLN
jgi:HK97 family phage major capsid protein